MKIRQWASSRRSSHTILDFGRLIAMFVAASENATKLHSTFGFNLTLAWTSGVVARRTSALESAQADLYGAMDAKEPIESAKRQRQLRMQDRT